MKLLTTFSVGMITLNVLAAEISINLTTETEEGGSTITGVPVLLSADGAVTNAYADRLGIVSTADQIQFSFKSDCWVDIRDSSHSFQLVGLMKAGDSRKLVGKPPFSIVLGDYAVVDMVINGKPYDLSIHRNGKIARFELDISSLGSDYQVDTSPQTKNSAANPSINSKEEMICIKRLEIGRIQGKNSFSDESITRLCTQLF